MIKSIATIPFLLPVCLFFISCNANIKYEKTIDAAASMVEIPKADSVSIIFSANAVRETGKIINCIFQDSKNNYWFSTNGDGVYRYNGRDLIRFTKNDGLSDDYVGAIQEDKSGNIWFSTVSGISRFDGRIFTAFTVYDSLPLNGNSDQPWKIDRDDLLFAAGGGVYRYSPSATKTEISSFSYLPLPPRNDHKNYQPGPSNQLSPYGVYSILKDRNGNYWLGTQTMGVCRFDTNKKDGVSEQSRFTWITGKGLDGPAVRCLFEDSRGIFWFGNNGNGLFRYDPEVSDRAAALIVITDEHGLANKEFVGTGKAKSGTLARVWTINEGQSGDIWIGTADAGAWHYDARLPIGQGNKLTNYTTLHGLTSNSINTIYKDKKGELWFGTDGAGVCKFNGVSFTKF